LSRTKRELEAELAKQVASTEHLANQLSILTAEEGLPLEDLERALDIVRRQRGTRAITINITIDYDIIIIILRSRLCMLISL
jgi:hypothetical protein